MGWVQAWVDPHDNNDQVSANAYEVRVLSKVESEDQSRSYGIGTMILPRNFAVYATFLDEGGGGSGGWYGDYYSSEGPFHTNTSINISSSTPGRDYDPWFYSLSMSEDAYYYYDGAYTQCSEPQIGNLWIEPYARMLKGEPYFALGVDPVPFGSSEVTWASAYNAASSGGLVLPLADGSRMMLRDSTLIVKQFDGSIAVQYDLSSLTNPVVWIDNFPGQTVYLKGFKQAPPADTTGLSIPLTIGVNGNLGMSGSLLYQDDDLLNPDNDIMLGIIVKGNFVIAEDPSNPNWSGPSEWAAPWSIDTYDVGSLRFDGVIMVMDGFFQVELDSIAHWPSPAIDLSIVGSYIINEEGDLNWAVSGNTWGYSLHIVYDPRLMNINPPFYPQTGIWDTAYWEEEPELTESNIGENQQ